MKTRLDEILQKCLRLGITSMNESIALYGAIVLMSELDETQHPMMTRFTEDYGTAARDGLRGLVRPSVIDKE